MRRWVTLREVGWDLVLERPEERVCGRCGQVFRARYRPQRLCAVCVEEGSRLSADGLRERRAVQLVGLREECGEAWRGPAGRLPLLRPVWSPETWAAVQEWQETWPHGPGLVLWGPERTGKTALAVGLVRWACERHGVVGRFVSAPRLLGLLRRFPSVEAAERTVLAGLLEEPLVVVDALGEGEEGVERAWVAALGCWLADRVMWKQRLLVTTRRSPAALAAWFGAAAWEVFGGMVRFLDLSARTPGGEPSGGGFPAETVGEGVGETVCVFPLGWFWLPTLGKAWVFLDDAGELEMTLLQALCRRLEAPVGYATTLPAQTPPLGMGCPWCRRWDVPFLPEDYDGHPHG